MAIDTSKAFGQSYMEGFMETFDPQKSPFQQTGLDLARNIERVQLLEKQRQAEMTDMYGRVKMPSGTQMYGNDFAKAKEMTELLTSEATLEKYAESPETQREYAALVNKANQFIADATAYYKTTYGNGDPKTGTYSGSVSRMAIDGFYEKQGYVDARDDYDTVFQNLDEVSYNPGSLRIEGNDFVFDDKMGTSSISDVNFQNIDVFQPQLEQSRFTSSAEAFSKLPGVKGAKSRSQAKEASMAYLQSDVIRERDAYNEYKQIDPDVATFEVAMADAATRDKILDSYADAMAANWKAPKPKTTTDTEKEIPPIPEATQTEGGMVMTVAEGTRGSTNRVQLEKAGFSTKKVEALRFTRIGDADKLLVTLSQREVPIQIDLNNTEDADDRARLAAYLDSVYGSGAATEIFARLRSRATEFNQGRTFKYSDK